MDRDLLSAVPGGPELLDWFGGYAPLLHDAEVLEITLDRRGPVCSIKVHGFEMTPEVDAFGYFICTRHAVITFRLDEVTRLELEDFSHQNALMGLGVARTVSGGFCLEFDPANGVSGLVEAQRLEISIAPGIPPDSIYLEAGARRAGVG